MKFVLECPDCGSKNLAKEDLMENFICNDCLKEFKLDQATVVEDIKIKYIKNGERIEPWQ